MLIIYQIRKIFSVIGTQFFKLMQTHMTQKANSTQISVNLMDPKIIEIEIVVVAEIYRIPSLG
jgi:hypothetical protein